MNTPNPPQNSCFWMVYAEGKLPPNKRHTTVEAAFLEAKRIAEKEGVSTFVLATIGGFYPLPKDKYEVKPLILVASPPAYLTNFLSSQEP